MFAALLNIFRISDLRRKVLITLSLCVVYRLGAFVPVPYIDPSKLSEFLKGGAFGGGVMSVINMFSGGAFGNMTIFALGIMPYISAQIIIQLLAAVWPPLEKLRREGEAGQRKITQWTRYGTVGLSMFQGMGLGIWLYSSGLALVPANSFWWRLFFLLFTAMTMSTGTCFIMWLGEKISAHGIGNGISIIITIGIIARYPTDIGIALSAIHSGNMPAFSLIAVLALTVVVSGLIIYSLKATRKIPVQHARRMVGRRMTQGGNTFIPLLLNTAGVIPVIFASSILTFPFFAVHAMGTFGLWVQSWLEMTSPHNPYDLLGLESGGVFSLLKVVNVYSISYIALTVFFCFFYTAITLNPLDLADNLKKSGAFIPGIKPGKHTADYLDHVMVRITVVGAGFLVVVAMVPEVLHVAYGVTYQITQLAGGTGLIIVVGVVLDTMQQIESQLLMRHYEGFHRSGGAAGGRLRRGPIRLRSQARNPMP
jgi:preprotein translocase subunit SecY